MSWSCLPISRSKEGRCAAGLVCLAIGRSDSITILGDLFATYLTYFMCLMPIAVKTPTGPIVAHGLLLARGCASWHKNRVLQSAEPKEAVVQRDSLEFYEPRSHRDEVCRVRDDESAVVVLSHTWLTASSSHGAENNGPGSSAVGETRVRASPHGTHGSPASPGARPPEQEGQCGISVRRILFPRWGEVQVSPGSASGSQTGS
jgi:hypothetical protein